MTSYDEIFEIMSWLPAKPLHKIATIAKPCLDFLSETTFMEKQCKNSCFKPEESLIIQDNSYLRCRVNKVNLCFLPEYCHDNGIPKKSLRFLTTKGRILGSSNGLILCWTIDNNKPTKLFLCNPVTKTWVPIKLPSKEVAKNNGMDNLAFTLVCGNLFGNKNKKFPFDYTILGFVKHISINNPEDYWNSGYDLYMLEQGEWLLKAENLATGLNDLSFDDQVCCKTGVFFVSEFGICCPNRPNYWPYIVHFDIENITSKIIALPEEARVNFIRDDCISFRVFGWDRKEGNSWFESMCLVIIINSYDLMNIWVLEDESSMDKNSSPWRKILSLSIVDDLGVKNDRSWMKSFTILDKKMIFANQDGYIYRCCLDGGNFGKLEKICKHHGSIGFAGLRFNAYSTTIRPCFKDQFKLPKKIK